MLAVYVTCIGRLTYRDHLSVCQYVTCICALEQSCSVWWFLSSKLSKLTHVQQISHFLIAFLCLTSLFSSCHSGQPAECPHYNVDWQTDLWRSSEDYDNLYHWCACPWCHQQTDRYQGRQLPGFCLAVTATSSLGWQHQRLLCKYLRRPVQIPAWVPG